jgi:ribosomal protein S2
VDFPIPGNDDAIRSIRLFARLVSDTLIEARAATAAPGRDVEAAKKAEAGAGSAA